jgi:hypothetical protein
MPNARRLTVSSALGVAGILVLVGILLAVVNIPFAWAFELSALALAVAFGAVGLAEEGVMRLSFAGAAVGWVLVAATGFVVGEAGVFGAVGEVIALVGGVAGGILAYRRRRFGRRADLMFLIATILTAVYLVATIRSFLPTVAYIVIAVLWGAGLIVSAVFILRKR